MDASTKSLAEGLFEAIQAERDAHSFYKMAAATTKDPKGKEMFGVLAEEELEHAGFLATQYRSVLDTGVPDPDTELPDRSDLTDSPIFTDEIRSRIKEAHYEMSALSIGIQLELASIKFYRDQSEATEDPWGQEFYAELADWESGHYHLLLRQQDALKNDYWAAAGFAPLY